MLYFGRVSSSWGHRAFFGSSWGEKVITPRIKYHHTFVLSFENYPKTCEVIRIKMLDK
jgi:hypothetical protein